MLSVLTLCTGNICRSPAAELLLARALGPAVDVSSAGTHAMVGHGIPAPMLLCLAGDDIDGRGHAARQYTAGLAASADLIVCMTAAHRAFAVSEAPSALRRVFLLSELEACAVDGVPLMGGLGGVAAAVAEHRPYLAGRSLYDVPDPYGRSQAAYDSSYAVIAAAVAAVGEWVTGSPA